MEILCYNESVKFMYKGTLCPIMSENQIKIGMMSLGCPKNQCDAELLLFRLREAGYEIVADVADADCAIVNTCGFIESAREESVEEIIELGKLKADGKIKAIVVTGCLAERYRDEILTEMHEVDAVCGIGANGDIAEVIKSALSGDRISKYGEKEDLPLSGGRVITTPGYFAYLRISEGCSNCCSYCAIPSIRGKYRSRPFDEIIHEAKILAGRGVKELVVVAQDTTRYGDDLQSGETLSKLLSELCKINSIEWLRVLYCYPDRIDDELLSVIASEDKICKYMDIPLQHCNGDVLRAMNRSGDKESLINLINHIREMVPGIALRTTVMVGFPGETRAQMTELCEFIREAKFERLGCFVFSPEEGTAAEKLPGRVSEKEGLRRQEIVMDEQSRAVDAWCDSMTGKQVTVLVEGYDRLAEMCYGRTQWDSPEIDCKVFFTSDQGITEGDFVTVEITDRMDCDLIGERI